MPGVLQLAVRVLALANIAASIPIKDYPRDISNAAVEPEDAAFHGQYINYSVPPKAKRDETEPEDAAFHGQYINYNVPPKAKRDETEPEDAAFHGQYVNYNVPPKVK